MLGRKPTFVGLQSNCEAVSKEKSTEEPCSDDRSIVEKGHCGSGIWGSAGMDNRHGQQQLSFPDDKAYGEENQRTQKGMHSGPEGPRCRPGQPRQGWKGHRLPLERSQWLGTFTA